MKQLFNMVKNYIIHILVHRDIYRSIQKKNKKKYCLAIQLGMTLEYTFHDLNKIFTLKFLDYVVAYNSIVMGKNMDYEKLSKLSMHDLWLADSRPRATKLYKHIFRLMEENDGFKPEYLELVADALIKTAERVGEDPVAVYFRNYRQFKLSVEDRNHFENAIGVDLDGYFGEVPDYCIEKILLRSRNKELNRHIVYTLLNEHGINILSVLDLNEKYII